MLRRMTNDRQACRTGRPASGLHHAAQPLQWLHLNPPPPPSGPGAHSLTPHMLAPPPPSCPPHVPHSPAVRSLLYALLASLRFVGKRNAFWALEKRALMASIQTGRRTLSSGDLVGPGQARSAAAGAFLLPAGGSLSEPRRAQHSCTRGAAQPCSRVCRALTRGRALGQG